MSGGVRIQILTVGREILTGKTLDTNSNWLCKRINALGGWVERLVTVDDRVEAIRKEIEDALGAGFRLVLTTGGLGPTRDDLTLEGVALAMERPLERHPAALEFVKDRYRRFYEKGAVDAPDLTPQREKMAVLPRGAQMLPNRVGAAPGVWLEGEGWVVCCLPGVPGELHAIFEDCLEDRIRSMVGPLRREERRVSTRLGDESVLGELVEKVMKRVSGVYLKTLPTTYGAGVRLQVRLEAAGEDLEEIRARLERAERALAEEVERWEGRQRG